MRALLWFLLIVGSLCVGAMATLAFVIPEGSLLSVASVMLWPVIGVLILLVIAAVIKAIRLAIAPAFGDDSMSRLLSAGIVALLFSGTLQSLFSPLINLVFDLFSQVPRMVANGWIGSDLFKRCAQPLNDAYASTCVQPLLNILIVPGTDALSRFGRSISGLDIAMLIAAFAAWALLGQLFSAMVRAPDQQGGHSRWSELMASFKDSSSPLRANCLLLVIIACGAVLSAAALIAIPVIYDSAPLSDKDIQHMQAEVDTLLKNVDGLPEASPIEGKLTAGMKALRAEFERTTQSEPITAGSAPASKPATQDADTARAAAAAKVAVASLEFTQDAENIEAQARRIWLAARDSVARQLGDLKGTAHDLIQRQNLAATNLRSKSGYVLDIKNWVGASVRSTTRQVAMCRAIIEDVTSGFLRDARYELEAARDPRNQNFGRASLGERYRLSASFASTCSGYSTIRTPDMVTLPALGPFSFAAWLITLSSIPLTLVTGMLGFGLLGASISSIVRNREDREPNAPLVKDLSELLIRGMSATIVVYLAVKGGLAIFAGTNAPEPNPYVLLLTCFVASVFSEDVWMAAKVWLLKKLGTRDSKKTANKGRRGTGSTPPGSALPRR